MSTISIQSPAISRVAAGRAVSEGPVSERTVRRTKLRLTMRGRRVLAGLAAAPLVAGIAFSVLAGGSALASGQDAAAVSFQTVHVAPGDTLWGIAAEVAPGVDPRDVIDDIMSLNNFSSATIQAGEEIAIPTKYAR
ncbi:LysM peptidoglycan-binding domain-containing protein [Microbacterium sp.]|uniref:LysM peptidoglycan-binding domain-containing protein n=1 Tax=Microbacterium sp. TaxID=51671 RepID=UPI003C71D15C